MAKVMARCANKLLEIFDGANELSDLLTSLKAFVEDTFGYKNVSFDFISYGEDIVFEVKTEIDRYVLKLILSRPEYVKYLPSLFHELLLKGIPCPTVKRTVNDKDFCRFKGHDFIMYEWCSGLPTRPDYEPHCKSIARLLSKIHLCTEKLSISKKFPSVLYPIYERVCTLEKMKAALPNKEEALKLLIANIQKIINKHLDAIKRFDSLNYPLILTHEELRSDNCFFSGDDVSCIIDWESSRRQYRIDSIAQTAVWYSLNPKNNKCAPPSKEYVQLFFDEYCRGNPVDNYEKDLLVPLLAFHSARVACFWPDQVFGNINAWLSFIEDIGN